MKKNYREKYIKMSDEELRDIYQNNRGDYVNEVYIEIEKILEERNVAFEKIKIDENTEKKKEVKSTYLPMILGVISIILTIFLNLSGHEENFNFWDGIAFTIGFRIVFITYCVNLCEEYQLSKSLWIILVLLLGGWAMIAINIGLLSPKKTTIDQPNESEDFKDFREDKKYTHCPACLNDLNGYNKCYDCDLEFD